MGWNVGREAGAAVAVVVVDQAQVGPEVAARALHLGAQAGVQAGEEVAQAADRPPYRRDLVPVGRVLLAMVADEPRQYLLDKHSQAGQWAEGQGSK